MLFQIRLPRVVLGAMVGATLAVAGTAYQGVFHNPLADPYLLGVSSGAGLGATLGIVAGGSIGLLLAAYGVHALVALGGAGIPRAGEIGLDVRVVLFTMALSIATGLVFGIAPAMRFSRPTTPA